MRTKPLFHHFSREILIGFWDANCTFMWSFPGIHLRYRNINISNRSVSILGRFTENLKHQPRAIITNPLKAVSLWIFLLSIFPRIFLDEQEQIPLFDDDDKFYCLSIRSTYLRNAHFFIGFSDFDDILFYWHNVSWTRSGMAESSRNWRFSSFVLFSPRRCRR